MANPHASADELARFGALAPSWWDTAGPMRELHRMNPLRTAWIAARLGHQARTMLDIGCGAGIATEALARRGLQMTGLDGSPEAIDAAIAHAAAAGLDVDYRAGLAHELAAAGASFDAIAALEIIEHVPDQAAFMATLASLLRPGGRLFVSTLNRTLRSLAVAKIGAEYLVRLLPVGTHDWRRFVRPDELAGFARAAGLRTVDVAGMSRSPTGAWSESRDTAINYIACFGRD